MKNTQQKQEVSTSSRSAQMRIEREVIVNEKGEDSYNMHSLLCLLANEYNPLATLALHDFYSHFSHFPLPACLFP